MPSPQTLKPQASQTKRSIRAPPRLAPPSWLLMGRGEGRGGGVRALPHSCSSHVVQRWQPEGLRRETMLSGCISFVVKTKSILSNRQLIKDKDIWCTLTLSLAGVSCLPLQGQMVDSYSHMNEIVFFRWENFMMGKLKRFKLTYWNDLIHSYASYYVFTQQTIHESNNILYNIITQRLSPCHG